MTMGNTSTKPLFARFLGSIMISLIMMFICMMITMIISQWGFHFSIDMTSLLLKDVLTKEQQERKVLPASPIFSYTMQSLRQNLLLSFPIQLAISKSVFSGTEGWYCSTVYLLIFMIVILIMIIILIIILIMIMMIFHTM